jgi:hypothetical protein
MTGIKLKPREAVGDYLNDDDPPKRLIVTTRGVSVADG